MSTHENRLCRLIVREHFGPIVEKVANVLIRKGRMPVPMIAKFTELTIRQVRESLVVLIQQNLAVYAETQEKTRIVTYYEVNRVEILHRVVIPKVLFSTQEWFEREGGMVAQAILTHGKLTITDCIADILKTTGTAAGRSTTQRTIAIKKAFTKMVKEKCLIAVRPSDSLTAADRDMVEEKRETDKLSMPPTAAQKAEIRRIIESKRAGVEGGNHIVGLKRTLDTVDDDDWEMDKRRKLTSSDVQIVDEVEEDVYFKINFERYTIRWRNAKIAEMFESRLNLTAKKIVETILKLSEDRMINCKEEHSSAVNVMMLFNRLPSDINMMDTLEYSRENQGKLEVGECLDKYMDLLEDDRMEIVRKYQGRSGQYIVLLQKAAKVMKKKLIQEVVTSRFGLPYVRIMNMLLEKGKLEEKMISKFSMMPVKDVREKLTTLCTFGVLNLQEVPKTQERAPSRTFYLWEVVEDRAATTIVDRLYQTMANLRQRRFVERSKRAVLLAKTERTDVKENAALLNDAETRELDTLNTVLEKLEIQELRIAEMVLVLRDY